MRTALRIVVYIAFALSIGAAALAQDNGQTNRAENKAVTPKLMDGPEHFIFFGGQRR
jgi:hypothetical protein